MNRHHAILNPFSFALALLALLSLSLPADEQGGRILKRVVPAGPGYLNRGAPYNLRTGARSRPPVYSLPSLPINPDPQPIPLASRQPAQPLNRAGDIGTGATGAPIPVAPVPGARPFTVEAKTFMMPTLPFSAGGNYVAPTGGSTNNASAFLNPQILRYFNLGGSTNYQSRLLFYQNSHYNLPSQNPMMRRGSSATYEIK
ncbi:MAG: hypothetical protein HOH86_07475 [Verrucomicrobiales bacterium]|nr:hypothetical protein [Verrucomicrobiales bacterium]